MAASTDDRLAHLGALAAAYGETALATEAAAERARLAAAQFFVACVGQFKRGKTTLINALVGESVLPVGLLPVTAVVTLLRYDQQHSTTVHFLDGRAESISPGTIADYVDERRNAGNVREVAAVEVRLPAAVLRDGLCLVDTPGVGSVHASNTAATTAFLPRVDVALLVVGPDPPVAATELEIVRTVLAGGAALLVVLNKADQVGADERTELLSFTRRALVEAGCPPPDRLFAVSARAALSTTAERDSLFDWAALVESLRSLVGASRGSLLAASGQRAARRLARRLDGVLAIHEKALEQPLAATEARVTTLQQATAGLERTLIDLRFLFESVEAELSRGFEDHHARFLAQTGPRLQHELRRALTEREPRTRHDALEMADSLAASAVEAWLTAIEPVAAELYTKAERRLLDVANAHLRAIAAEADSLDDGDVPDAGFHVRRGFYFTHLMNTTAGTPATWAIDHLAPRSLRLRRWRAAAESHLDHLLVSNSHRVTNDCRDRVRESRRRCEAQIRQRLHAAQTSAERALARAVEARSGTDASLLEARLRAVRTDRATLQASRP